MKKAINKTYVEGLLYEHNLEKRVTGENSKHPGTEYINGSISVATDDDINVVKINYTYVTATTSKGAPNRTFGVLSQIIDTDPTVVTVGKENALRVKVDSTLGVNDFYANANDENPVSQMRNEGGFISIIKQPESDTEMRSRFEVDCVLVGLREVEADESRNLPEKVMIKGYIFNFRNEVFPAEFTVLNEGGKDYFRNAEISMKNPMFTKLGGMQVSQTQMQRIEEPSAFGGPVVKMRPTSQKAWVCTSALEDPYEWDDDSTITAQELTQKLADREVYLADIKNRMIQRQASKTVTPAIKSNGGYNF